ncbi:hypothetical protein COCVIDRAFT_20749 [Bipolaris victoriae FI3]|uniref:Uncharacterized protein n=1 Tax=Bipolaris victoriae (strain FI3) TaxID=930091 RepID=W7DYW2_BIPV3|nr:hypothetical protein COCVIDRAFT_20749 [Bipolaris victoriae FI3]
MRSPDAVSTIAHTIRDHGNLAKQRLRVKWRNLGIYKDNMFGDESMSTEPTKTEQTTAIQKQSTRTITARKELFRIAFCDTINDQCYKLGKHTCIILEGNACGDAVIIRHDWTERDTARYKANRTLPMSLVGGIRSRSLSALVLRFIAHNWPPRVPPSQIFEPTRVRTIEIPLCMSQPFIYVAATISSSSIDGQPIIDKLILLPSKDTSWSVKYKGCKVYDDETRTRNWRLVIQTLGEGQGAGQPRSSLMQLPFLNRDAEPLCNVYDFSNGSVYERFDDLLCDQDSHYVTLIHGLNGLLQRQWNQGSPRMQNTGSSATHIMMCWILTTLPPNTQPMATDHFESIYNEKKKYIVKERDCTESRAKEFSHKAMIGDDNYGMPLADIMAQFGFETKRHVPCNQCFANGKLCDNRADSCKRCKTKGNKCVREACKNRSEPGDESNCHRDCDLAHDDDGYTNVSRVPRTKGYNARLRLQQEAQKGIFISSRAENQAEKGEH